MANPKVTIKVEGATNTGKTSIAWLITEALRLHGFHDVKYILEKDFKDESSRDKYVRGNYLHSGIRTTEITVETVQTQRVAPEKEETKD